MLENTTGHYWWHKLKCQCFSYFIFRWLEFIALWRTTAVGNFIKLFDISKYFFLNYSNKASPIKQISSSSQILLLVTAAQIPDKPMHQNEARIASGSYVY